MKEGNEFPESARKCFEEMLFKYTPEQYRKEILNDPNLVPDSGISFKYARECDKSNCRNDKNLFEIFDTLGS